VPMPAHLPLAVGGHLPSSLIALPLLRRGIPKRASCLGFRTFGTRQSKSPWPLWLRTFLVAYANLPSSELIFPARMEAFEELEISIYNRICYAVSPLTRAPCRREFYCGVDAGFRVREITVLDMTKPQLHRCILPTRHHFRS